MIGPLPDQPCVHLDRGYDSTPTRDLLDELGYFYESARKGIPAPIQAGKGWVVERTHSWMNGYGKIRRCTEKRRSTVEFSLHLAATLTVIRRLINEARTRYRWPAHPTPADSSNHQLPDVLSPYPSASQQLAGPSPTSTGSNLIRTDIAKASKCADLRRGRVVGAL